MPPDLEQFPCTDPAFHPDMVPEIERWLRSSYNAPEWDEDHPCVDWVFETERMFPLQRKAELAAMLRKAHEYRPRCVMEIGADKAGGLYHWCKRMPELHYCVACEIRGTPYRRSFEAAFPHVDFLWVEASSYASTTVEAVRGWLAARGIKINVLFCDGDKCHAHHDIRLYEPMMSRPGVIFVHDILDEAPGRDWGPITERQYRARKGAIVYADEWRQLFDEGAAPMRQPRNAWEQWLLHWKGQSCGVGFLELLP